ncbi:hypothetical protein [Micrococcus luteus]|uniref:hypothetical protein n=1 Tax=Micrococcus luteus TaxID=1270 RepID=UPI00230397FC|nr:hypothetical protein [Micrococcus luteus]
MSYQNRTRDRRGTSGSPRRETARYRPIPFRHLGKIPTLWADYKTGQGVMGNGQRVQPKIGPRRKSPNLQDMLDTAADAGAQRIMFTGKVPAADQGQRHWLLVQTPGWNSQGHYLGTPITGRFERTATGQKVEVRTAAEWFGSTPLNPEQARTAWDALETIVGEFFPDGKLMKTPAATGSNLWAISLPANVNPVPVTPDIAEELHRTSGQHHIEHLVAGPSLDAHEDCVPLVDPAQTPQIPAFSYVDGRFMYAALCRELGIGPAVRLNKADTYDMLENDPYARARVYVRFQVPQGWNHIGIFGCQHENVRDGWYYPNRPGATGQTWADAAEIHIARAHGWMVDPQESVVFATKVPGLHDKTKNVTARPLDTWANRLIKAREAVDADPQMPEIIKAAVSGSLRAMLIQTIGNFASRGRKQTFISYDPKDVDPYAKDVRQQGKAFVWTSEPMADENVSRYYRPELAMQVWARGRARLLSGPMADGAMGGALHVPAHTLLGVRGDAIYTTELPRWSLPVERGGSDDGKIGRMRLQGYLEGPMKTPVTEAERNTLRAKSARLGVDAAYAAHEFTTPGDNSDYMPTESEES